MTTHAPQTGLHTTMKEGHTTAGSTGPGGYGRMILTVKSGHDMHDKALVGKSDPYVELRLADATISTHHIPNAGETCTWDESFAFNNVAPDDVLEFHVYDKNRVRKDALMGEGSLTLREVFEHGHMETRVPLLTRSNKSGGELWVSMKMEGEGTYAVGKKSETHVKEGHGAGYGQKIAATEGYGTAAAATVHTDECIKKETPHAVTETSKTKVGQEEAVCGQEYFTKTEDRPVIRERVTYLKEHRPVEKEFVVETRATGVEREAHTERKEEHMGTEEKVVAEAAPKSPCE